MPRNNSSVPCSPQSPRPGSEALIAGTSGVPSLRRTCGRTHEVKPRESGHLECPVAASVAAEPFGEGAALTVGRDDVVGHRHGAAFGGTAVAGSQVVVKVRMTGGVVEREELRIGANPFSFPRIMCGVVVVEVGELRLRSAVDDEPLLGRGPRPVAPEAAARPPWWRSQPHDPPRTCPVPLLPRSGIVSPTHSRTSSSGPVNLGPIGPTIPFSVSRRLPPPWYQGVVGTLL
jgi:hypothetical protein